MPFARFELSRRREQDKRRHLARTQIQKITVIQIQKIAVTKIQKIAVTKIQISTVISFGDFNILRIRN